MKDKDRRIQPRHELVWNIHHLKNSGIENIGYLKNFSLSGLLFASKVKFNIGDLIYLKITIPEKLFEDIKEIQLDVPVKIVREDKQNSVYLYNYGAQFDNHASKLQDNIKSFLEYWKKKEMSQ